MKITGKVWKFGDNINTDQIIPTKYMLLPSIAEMSKYIFSNYREEFAKGVKRDDFIIAGDNFGCGSAREQAPQVIKESGISAIIAESFHTTFFRNAINVGLICFKCPGILEFAKQGDEISVDIVDAMIENLTQNTFIMLPKISSIGMEIIQAGGLINYFLQNNIN